MGRYRFPGFDQCTLIRAVERMDEWANDLHSVSKDTDEIHLRLHRQSTRGPVKRVHKIAWSLCQAQGLITVVVCMCKSTDEVWHDLRHQKVVFGSWIE